MSLQKYCDGCEGFRPLTGGGYCRRCGVHADNMPDRKTCDTCSFYALISPLCTHPHVIEYSMRGCYNYQRKRSLP